MQQKFSINKGFLPFITLLLIVFAVMLSISYRNKKQENNNALLIAQSQENLYQTTLLLSQITDNESAARGYLLTGNRAFLEPLTKSKLNVGGHEKLLRSLNTNTPHRQKLIDSLIDFAGKRIAFSDTTIKVRNEQGLLAAAKLVESGRGKFYLDEVRKIIAQITTDENTSLTQRLLTNAGEERLQRDSVILVVFLIIVLLALLIWNEKKKIEERVERQSRNKMEILWQQLNQSNDAIYSLDANRNIQSWNVGACKLYGYSEEEVIGKESNELLKTVITAEEIIKALIVLDEKQYWAGELERKTKTGETIQVAASTTCIKDSKGNITGYVAVSRDITVQGKLNDRLNHMADIVEQSSEAIFSRGMDERIISWNNGAEQLFGFNMAEVIGKTVTSLGILPLTEEEVGSVETDINEKGKWRAEKICYHKNGASFYGFVTANKVQNKKGKTTSFNYLIKDISQRKALEKELRNTNEALEAKVEERTKAIIDKEKIYRNLFENNPLPMWVIDAADFTFLDVNKTAMLHYGYSREEFLSMTALDIRPGIEVEAFKNIDRLRTDKEMKNQGVWIHVKKDRTQIAVEIYSQPILFETKIAALVMVNDVTEKKRAVEKIIENEQRFRTLLENNYDIILLMDETHKIIYRSPSATKLTGWTDEETKDVSLNQIIHPDDLKSAVKIQKELISNPGKPIKTLFRTQHKTGHYLWMEGTITSMLHDKTVNAIVFNFKDVTERITYQEKLKASEEQFRYSMDNMLEGVQIVGFDWKYIYVNEALCKQRKYLKEELIGYTMMEKYPGIEKSELFINCSRCMAERISIHFENVFTFVDGSTQWYQLSLQPVPEGIFILSVDITERKIAEEKLKSSEERFRSLIENIADAIVVNDAHGNILYQSKSVTKILGYTAPERSTKNIIDYLHPDDNNEFVSVYKKLDEFPNTPISFQYRARHKNGHYIWLEGVVTNLLDQPGVNAYVTNYRDVTKRKELEELLNKTYTIAKIGGWEVDLIEGTVYWSNITREIHETSLDYKPDLQSGLNFYKEGADKQLITEKVQQAIESGTPWDVELQIITAKNNLRWVRTMGETEFVDGKCIRVYGSFQDIDDRKKTEEKIIESEKLYRNLFTNMLNGFCYFKAIFKNEILVDCTYLAVNKEYGKLIGLSNVTGKKLSDIMPDTLESDPEYRKIITDVLLSGESRRFETFATSLNKWLSVSIYSPKKGYFVTLVDNITEQKEAEEKIKNLNHELEEKIQLRTAQLKKSNEELEAFSYSVSHDLRAPLRAIIGYTTMLQDEHSNQLNEEAKRITKIIKNNTQRMGHLIDDLLAFSRLGKQEILKTAVSSGTLVNNVIETLRATDTHNIKWTIHTLPDVAGDTSTLTQVWINLISNAVKYASKKENPTIEIGSLRENDKIIFYVKDNGVGFNEKYKGKLFKVFQRLHSTEEFEGTGIGLAIVDKIISKHGGTVWAEAAVNEGATFYFSLPLLGELN